MFDLSKLGGYKTYIMAALIMLASVLFSMGYLDQNTFLTVLGILNGGGLAALRVGVKKSGPEASE